MGRPLIAEINLAALRYNYQLALQAATNGQAIAVIKANAYGHGSIEVAKALADLAPAFAVACIEEAEELVAAGVPQPILLLEGFFTTEELALIFQRGYNLVIHASWQLEILKAFTSKAAAYKLQPISIWLKVDTGMHRLGLESKAIPKAYAWLGCQPWVREVILTSHLAMAEQLNNPATLLQLERLEALEQHLGCDLVSLANSAAVLGWPQAARGWLRPGIMLYGASPFAPGHFWGDQLKAVMSLKSRLISLRYLNAGEALGYGGHYVTAQPSCIGVVACGYGDGYPRQAKNYTPVLVKGVRCRLVGRVSMDMLMVDLSGVPNPKPGDAVELWGAKLSVNEVASYCDTISYTLLTGLLPRVPKVYSC